MTDHFSLLAWTFWISSSLLAYTWLGYYLVLNILARMRNGKLPSPVPSTPFTPKVTVIVAALNEEAVIGNRIRNLLQCDYPKDLLQIVIASDGSTDETVSRAAQFASSGVEVLDFPRTRGRAEVHNDCVPLARGEVIVFSDAATLFDAHCISELVQPLSDPKIGAVIGCLSYSDDGSSISAAESFYWKHELELKDLENRLNIVANGTGACMAIRKDLFKRLKPSEDVDTASVIDIILAGYKVLYQRTACARDIPPRTVKGELRMRVRTVPHTISTFLSFSRLVGLMRHPFVTWGFFSHRLLRYVSGVLMILALVTNILLLHENFLYFLAFAFQMAFYALVVIGALTEIFGKRLPATSLIFSFGIAIAGITIGLMRGIVGFAPSSYKGK